MDNISSWLTYDAFILAIEQREGMTNCNVQVKLITSTLYQSVFIGDTFEDVDIWQGRVVLDWEIDGMVAKFNAFRAEAASVVPYTKYSFLYRFNKF